MANFTALKTAINNAIKTNGNEEITGAILQAILDAMVETLGDSAITDLENAITTEVTNRENAVGDVAADLAAEAQARQAIDYNVNNRINAEEYNRQNADAAISQTMSQGFQTLGSQMTALNAAISALNAAYQNGYLYGGIATPSSSPSNNKCFYIALQGGTYTNFGGVGVVEGINIIKNDSGWKVEHIYDQTTLLNEFYLLRQQVIQAITSFAPIVIEGDVTNAPDEEDLTSNANHLLQFKNNTYSPLEFSGLGRKYLRKNIAPLSESAPFNGFVEGVTAEETLSGTPTQIFWDRMNTRFVGIKDGVYYLEWTDSDNYVPVSTSLVYMYNGTPYQWTGSDFIVDETEVPDLVNCLTQDMINEANTIYIIRYDYTLKENITIPANCVLEFDGGSISGEHTITLNNVVVQNQNFKDDVTFAGNTLTKDIITFATLQEAKAYPFFILPNTVVKTNGYWSENDGGGAEYVVKLTTTAMYPIDMGSRILMDNGEILHLIEKDSVNLRQFGGKSVPNNQVNHSDRTANPDSSQSLHDMILYLVKGVNGYGVNTSTCIGYINGHFFVNNVEPLADSGYNNATIDIRGQETAELIFNGTNGYDGTQNTEDGDSFILKLPIQNQGSIRNVRFTGTDRWGATNAGWTIAHYGLILNGYNDSYQGRVDDCVIRCFVKEGLVLSGLNFTGTRNRFDCIGEYPINLNIGNFFIKDFTMDMSVTTDQYQPMLNEVFSLYPTVHTWTINNNKRRNTCKSYFKIQNGQFNGKIENCRLERISNFNYQDRHYLIEYMESGSNNYNNGNLSLSNIQLSDYTRALIYAPNRKNTLDIAVNIFNCQFNFYNTRLYELKEGENYTKVGVNRVNENEFITKTGTGFFPDAGGGGVVPSDIIIAGSQILSEIGLNIADRYVTYGDIILFKARQDNSQYYPYGGRYIGATCIYPTKGYCRTSYPNSADTFSVKVENGKLIIPSASPIPYVGEEAYALRYKYNDTVFWCTDSIQQSDGTIAYTPSITIPDGNAVTIQYDKPIFKFFGKKENDIAGANRPTESLQVGDCYFDSSLNPKRPIWWNGTAWVDATGATV